MFIFDCDGVLVDSEAPCVRCEIDFLNRHGIEIDRADYLTRFLGKPSNVWIAEVRDMLRTECNLVVDDTYFDELNKEISSAIFHDLKSIVGMRDVLQALVGKCCVASSSSIKGLHRKLDSTGLLPLVAPYVYSTELVPRGKPYPDIFLHAAEAHGWEPRDCTVIEDSVNGVKAAKAAGMHVIGFLGGSHCTVQHEKTLRVHGVDEVVFDAKGLAARLNLK